MLAPTWIGFEDAAQVAQLRRTVTKSRTVTKKGKKTVEVVYLITSDRDAGPATLAAWVRGHWHGHTNIAAANRHHARDPRRTLKLLQAVCAMEP